MAAVPLGRLQLQLGRPRLTLWCTRSGSTKIPLGLLFALGATSRLASGDQFVGVQLHCIGTIFGREPTAQLQPLVSGTTTTL